MKKYFSRFLLLSMVVTSALFFVAPYDIHAQGIWNQVSQETFNSDGACLYEFTCSDVSDRVDPTSQDWLRSGTSCSSVGATENCFENILDFDGGCLGPNSGRSIDSIRTKYNYLCVANPIASPLPDLTAEVPNPRTAIAGVAQDFTSKIINQGDAVAKSSAGPIKNIFQISKSPDGSTNMNGALGRPTNLEVSVSSSIPPKTSASNFATISKSIILDVGVYYMRVCADATAAGGPSDTGLTGSVPELKEDNNCSKSTPWTTITVTNNDFLPDLTAGPASPTIATVNVTKKYTATIYNTGIADIEPGKSFPYFFQTKSVINEAEELNNLLFSRMPRIKVDENDTATSPSVSFAPASDATHKYFIRVCADKKSASKPTPPDPGDIIESNSLGTGEDNNCGDWTLVKVNPVPLPPVDERPNKPTVQTNPVIGITRVSAISGGNITSDGGSVVTNAGIIWGSNLEDNFELGAPDSQSTSSGWTSGKTFWNTTMTGLIFGPDYEVRAYATNIAGTSYGVIRPFTVLEPEIPGKCTTPPVHYKCSIPPGDTGTKRVSSPSKWVWTCSGSGGGASPECSEKKSPGFIEN